LPESSFYDLQSLAFATVTVSAVTVLCLGPAAWGFPPEYRGSLRSWILGTAAVVLSDVLFIINQNHPWSGIALPALIGVGVAEWRHAIRKFGGSGSRERWPYIFVAVMTALTLSAGEGYFANVVLSSISMATLYLGAALSAARLSQPTRPAARRVLIAALAVVALVMLIRLGLLLGGVRSGAPPGTTTEIRALLFVLASIGPIAGSLAFVLMCSERLGDELRHLAAIDPLTGLRNRRTLLEALKHDLAVARRKKQPVSFLTIDVDHFKRINDAHGHPAGDRALAVIAKTLGEALRVEDTIGRMGGEEFAVVLPGADVEAARVAAQRLRAAVAAVEPDPSSTPRGVTISVGVATTLSDGSEPDVSALIARADAAMYEAKRLGRDRVVVSP
jgi:diguanylate cyclase (GGDEF)-like protein